MVSILPPKRSIFNALGDAMSDFGRNAPQLLEERFQRQRGLSSLEQAEKAIKEGIIDPETNQRRDLDPYEMAIQFAKAGANNPGLERALGPLMQTAMQGGKVNRAFPEAGKERSPTIQGQPQIQGQQSLNAQQQQEPYIGAIEGQQGQFAKPSWWNIMTPQDIKAEGERYAKAVNDPNAAAMREQQLQNENERATQQRTDLENAALRANVKPEDLPRFMLAGAKNDPRNPSEWVQNTKRSFDTLKSNDKKINRAFIPGIGSALIGKNRDEELKRLVPTSQDMKRLGLEEETRQEYADNFMSPTEIEEQFRPLTPPKEKAIKALPRGLFPSGAVGQGEVTGKLPGFEPKRGKNPIISYEEARERAPQELKVMQNQLSDFFLKNVDPDTSLLVFREPLVNEKDYDWRQIGPAIREAEKKGLKLTQRQNTELADIETQPPMQSLPEIFRDLYRVVNIIRGNK